MSSPAGRREWRVIGRLVDASYLPFQHFPPLLERERLTCLHVSEQTMNGDERDRESLFTQLGSTAVAFSSSASALFSPSLQII